MIQLINRDVIYDLEKDEFRLPLSNNINEDLVINAKFLFDIRIT